MQLAVCRLLMEEERVGNQTTQVQILLCCTDSLAPRVLSFITAPENYRFCCLFMFNDNKCDTSSIGQ